EPGIFANSYLLEGIDGVLLIDANLLVSDARALAARLAALRKPLLAAFVTHAHPDHFNGLPYLVGDDVPVYAAAAVAETIAAIALPKREQWQPLYGDEWPDRYRVPDHPLPPGGAVEVGGLRVEVRSLGPAESHADSYLLVRPASQRAPFIGHLAYDALHSYTAAAHTGRWLDAAHRLPDVLRRLRPHPRL